MSRHRRAHLPGGTFHLTSRLLHREPLFTPPVRTALVRILREQVSISDVKLFAYAVMPNHLHLVLRQGDAPLSRFMQPFLRRAALLVQRAHRREGHVFERRYRDRFCDRAEYLRNAIVYTHLNPVRAGLCVDAGDYAWSSRRVWTGTGAAVGGGDPVSLDVAGPLFAMRPVHDRSALHGDYLAFESWTQQRDRFRRDADSGPDLPGDPTHDSTGHGDAHWLANVSASAPRLVLSRQTITPEPRCSGPGGELALIAQAVLAREPRPLEPAIVRSRWGGKPYVRARHEVIRRAADAGYRRVDIAAYLRISPTAVSDVLATDRKRFLRRVADRCDSGTSA